MSEWFMKACSDFAKSWERLLFGGVGVALLGFTFLQILANNVTAGASLFAMAFFSFFYSNLARFKKFKGLGFEAELWEDKQKEAADLIDRLKSIVEVYTHEIVMGSVMRGRFGADSWERRWALFDRLSGKHFELGQYIDFSDLKREVDSVFIFDLCSQASTKIAQSIRNGSSEATRKISDQYGSPVRDLEGHAREIQKLRTIHFDSDDLFERAKSGNIAQESLIQARAASDLLKSLFDVDVAFDAHAVARLEAVSELATKRPITITPNLIGLADKGLET